MSFILFARAHGVEITDLFASDRIKRCPTTDHPRSTNGAYFYDGQRGWVFNWSGEAKTQWYEDPNAKPWTEAEKAEWAAKRRAAAKEVERRNASAALFAGELLRTTKPGVHDYLIRKSLPTVQGLCLPDGGLLVPMRNWQTNALMGAQVIRWNGEEMKWEKKMVPGMKAKGAVLMLGTKGASEIVLCEGYATGLSIDLAAKSVNLRMAVLVCFSDSNMVHVAELLQASRTRRFVFADNDLSGAGRRAAEAAGLPYAISETEGFDANDMHAKGGLMPVAAMLMRLRMQELEATCE